MALKTADFPSFRPLRQGHLGAPWGAPRGAPRAPPPRGAEFPPPGAPAGGPARGPPGAGFRPPGTRFWDPSGTPRERPPGGGLYPTGGVLIGSWTSWGEYDPEELEDREDRRVTRLVDEGVSVERDAKSATALGSSETGELTEGENRARRVSDSSRARRRAGQTRHAIATPRKPVVGAKRSAAVGACADGGKPSLAGRQEIRDPPRSPPVPPFSTPTPPTPTANHPPPPATGPPGGPGGAGRGRVGPRGGPGGRWRGAAGVRCERS